MAVNNRKTIGRLTAPLLTSVSVCAYLSVAAPFAYAQQQTTSRLQAMEPNIPADAKLMLSANELVYDKDAERISAIGGVQINYGGYKMVSQRVEYNQKTGRMTAIGNIELIEPGGTRLYADTLDVTDNFADGFLNALRIETTDNTRFAAESGERIGGRDMVLNNGVYTACLPCAEHPERPPLWQIKAEKVIQNGEKRTVRLQNARFELFGTPIAWIPVLEVPDHTVKRKSGFLFPSMSQTQNLGFGLTIPYYYVISPSQDLTVSGTGYTKQGFLLDAEYRQRLDNGEFTIRAAGIHQANREDFKFGTSDYEKDGRGLIASKGDFSINPRWTFGWDVMVQSDNNFSRTYDLYGDELVHTNQAYLTGLGKRNFFDMRAFYFDIQDATTSSDLEKKQAIAAPVIDYSYYAPQPVAGGELSIDMNFTNIYRDKADVYSLGGVDRFRGLDGRMARMTTEAEWKRSFVAPGGLVLTPMLALRGDLVNVDMTAPNLIDPVNYSYAGGFDGNDANSRVMATAGLEARYPFLVSTDNSTHIIEPIAQIYMRPNEPMAGRLPNEDAQSFVFDATNLFERDKYSGYDRIEGGTRANVGIRYTGSFDNGYTLNGLFGQSYHLAGTNSFATDDLVYAGSSSGLETDTSDFVGMVGATTPFGLSLAASGRFDESNFSLQRTGATVAYGNDRFQSSLTYAHIDPQAKYGSTEIASEVQAAGSVRLTENFSVSGAINWDLNNDVISRRSVGFTYEDECTIFSLGISDIPDVSNTAANDWRVVARLSFRTLGDIRLGGNNSTDITKTNW